MKQTLFEILIVFALTLLNGFFAMSEIALISVRRSRVAQLIKLGSKRAELVQNLQSKPEEMFATVQIGISLVTIAASTFAGLRLASDLAEYLSQLEVNIISAYAGEISFVVVVGVVSYFSLVIGELVPKSLGFRYAEKFALVASYPIWLLSKFSFWLIKLLSFSTNLLLKPFKKSASFTESRLTEEELRLLLEESKKTGAIDKHEHSIIENVFQASDLPVSKIMVPRTRMTAFEVNTPLEKIIPAAIESGFSRLPIYQGTLNKVVGVLYTKKLLPKISTGLGAAEIKDFMVPPYFVPGTMKIDEVLRNLQRKKLHLALVTDEHGEIEGLVTLEDALEEIVGEIMDETDETGKMIVKNNDETFTVSGQISIVDFNRQFQASLPEDKGYTTLSGYILHKLARFPNLGDVLEEQRLKLEVKEKTMRTVKAVLITKK